MNQHLLTLPWEIHEGMDDATLEQWIIETRDPQTKEVHGICTIHGTGKYLTPERKAIARLIADLPRLIQARATLSRAIDLITTSIDGRMDDEPYIAEANELLCGILAQIPALSPACDAPTGKRDNPATPPIHELRIMLNAAAYWADNGPDEDHPDPMDEVCDLVRDANDLFNRIFPETPGQPIDIHAALANYDPTKEPSPWYRNHYICTECGTEWQDEHDCQCDDRCPKCNTSMQTHHSEDLTDD